MIDRTLKKGDVVSVRAVVRHDTDPGENYVFVRIGGEHKPAITVDLENVIAFIEPKIDVEDVVMLSYDREQSGTVRAIWEAAGVTMLWVQTTIDRMTTWRAGDVEVVEPPEPAPVAAPVAPPEA